MVAHIWTTMNNLAERSIKRGKTSQHKGNEEEQLIARGYRCRTLKHFESNWLTHRLQS